MPDKKDKTSAESFYDVEKYRELLEYQNSQPLPKGFARFQRRITRVIESLTSFLSAFLGIPLAFVCVFAVIIGALYGPLVFLAATGGSIGFLALYVEKKVGKSLEFGNAPFRRKLLGQILGSLLAMAFFLFLLLVLPKLI